MLICSKLENRNIIITLSGETLRLSAARGCLQGGVLSPVQWSLVVEELLWDRNDNHYYTVGYADNMAILTNGKFPQTVTEVLQTALGIVHQWCDGTDLFNSPNKTIIITFTRKK
jgi:hypothetical protein